MRAALAWRGLAVVALASGCSSSPLAPGDGSPGMLDGATDSSTADLASPSDLLTFAPDLTAIEGSTLSFEALLPFDDKPGAPQGMPALGVADFNSDGKPDVATAGSGVVKIHLDTIVAGLPSLKITSTVPIQSDPSDLVVADFNGDKKADIVVIGGGNAGLSVLLGDGTGKFSVASAPLGFDPLDLRAWDFDGDGLPDLAITHVAQGGGMITLLKNLGGGKFSEMIGYPTEMISRGPAIGDLDRDGIGDIVAPILGADKILFFHGRGGFVFDPPRTTIVPKGPWFATLGQFDADPNIDVMVSLEIGSSVGLLHGDGAGGLTLKFTFAAGNDPWRLVAADMNKDGLLDVVCANNGSGSVSVLLGAGGGTLQPSLDFRVDGLPTTVAVADFDLDGKPDIVVSGGGAPEITLLRNISKP